MFDYAWNREFKTQRRTPQLTMERCYYIRHLDKLSPLKIAHFHPLQNIAVKDSQSVKTLAASEYCTFYSQQRQTMLTCLISCDIMVNSTTQFTWIY